MSHQRQICGACGHESPWNAKQCGVCGSRMLRPAPRIRAPDFGKTLLLVVLLWTGTPIIAGVYVSATYDATNPYSALGVGLLSLVFDFFYILGGTIAGLAILRKNRPFGSGLLAGTGIGVLTGFATCVIVSSAVG